MKVGASSTHCGRQGTPYTSLYPTGIGKNRCTTLHKGSRPYTGTGTFIPNRHWEESLYNSAQGKSPVYRNGYLPSVSSCADAVADDSKAIIYAIILFIIYLSVKPYLQITFILSRTTFTGSDKWTQLITLTFCVSWSLSCLLGTACRWCNQSCFPTQLNNSSPVTLAYLKIIFFKI